MKNYVVNSKLKRFALSAFFLLSIGLTDLAYAGRNCEEKMASPEATANAFDAAENLNTWLNNKDTDLAIIVRQGTDLTKYGLTYSHAGFALKNSEGQWLVLHDLNKCSSASSNLYEQGLAEFFGDDLRNYDVAIVVPAPEVRQRLRDALSEGERFRFHQAHYSAVAYPFAVKYQNSNGWLIETFAKAVSKDDILSREAAQGRLKDLGYEPSVIELGMFTRLGGRMFKANIAFDDHPPELRWSGKITINAGDDVLRFVSRWGITYSDCPTNKYGYAVCFLKFKQEQP